METRFGDPVNAEDHFLPLKRALLLLNGVIKELSGVKMMTGVKNMSEACTDFIPSLSSLHVLGRSSGICIRTLQPTIPLLRTKWFRKL